MLWHFMQIMVQNIKSIRAFIGSKDYKISRQFYTDFGFEEVIISHDMSYFKHGNFGFYLQDYYERKWVDNLMLFLEVDNVAEHLNAIKTLNLPAKYNFKGHELCGTPSSLTF